MATITGTNGNDTLTGTAGNDLIIPLTGVDIIDGGQSNDTVDYSGLQEAIELIYKPLYSIPPSTESLLVSKRINDIPTAGKDEIKNVETIIGAANKKNNISVADNNVNIDLSKNLFTYSSPSGPKTLTIKNFTDVSSLTGKNTRIKGNDLDNFLYITTADFLNPDPNGIIFGSKGNDRLNAFTVDYSDLGRAVKFVPIGSTGRTRYSTYSFTTITIDKNGFGIDEVSNINRGERIKKIIGTTNKANSIDASTVSSLASIDVNLANNSLKTISVVKTGDDDTKEFTLVNFVDVIGSKYDDKIVGANKNGKLTGGGGNDSITGGSKNDIITGSDSTARGVGEVDTLTGGGGRDKFVLGDKNGAYYVGKGANDYALITDFDLTQDSISIGSLKNYSFALEGKDTIDLYSSKDINTRDLIAKIQIAGGISTVSSNAKSALSPDASLNAFVGKLNIISD
jgi:Ca2+-binding RTX toxin-like protein